MTRRRLLGEPCRASRQCHTCSLWPLRWLHSDRVCLCAVSSHWVWTLPAVPRGGAPPPHLPSGPSAGLASVACASWWGRPRLVAGGVKNRALRRLQVSPSFGSCCAGPASPPGPAAPRGLWCRSASLSWPRASCVCAAVPTLIPVCGSPHSAPVPSSWCVFLELEPRRPPRAHLGTQPPALPSSSAGSACGPRPHPRSLFLAAVRHRPGQAGGGWEEQESSPGSQGSSQENGRSKASDSGSRSGSDSPSGASRAPSDLAER